MPFRLATSQYGAGSGTRTHPSCWLWPSELFRHNIADLAHRQYYEPKPGAAGPSRAVLGYLQEHDPVQHCLTDTRQYFIAST